MPPCRNWFSPFVGAEASFISDDAAALHFVWRSKTPQPPIARSGKGAWGRSLPTSNVQKVLPLPCLRLCNRRFSLLSNGSIGIDIIRICDYNRNWEYIEWSLDHRLFIRRKACNTYQSGKQLKNGESLSEESKFYAKRSASQVRSVLITLGQFRPMLKSQGMHESRAENI